MPDIYQAVGIVMGGKSIAHRATSEWQRKRAVGQRMKDLMEGAAAREKTPPTRDTVTCSECGFKAPYRFLKCPACEAVQPGMKS